MHRALVSIALLLQMVCFSQDETINSRKRDSLIRSIEASRKALKASQDSFLKLQDSLYRTAQQSEQAEQNARNLVRLMAENKERNEKRGRTQRAYFISIGIVFIIILVIALRRGRKGGGRS